MHPDPQLKCQMGSDLLTTTINFYYEVNSMVTDSPTHTELSSIATGCTWQIINSTAYIVHQMCDQYLNLALISAQQANSSHLT